MIVDLLAQTDPRFTVPSVQWKEILPLFIMGIAPIILVVLVSLMGKRSQSEIGLLSMVFSVMAAGISFAALFPIWRTVQEFGPLGLVGGSLGVDSFVLIMWGLIIVMAAVASLTFERQSFSGRNSGVSSVMEQHVLLFLSATGGMIMVAANNLILLFVGLEVLSIAVYVLAALDLRRSTSQEAGFKYFALGAVSSAIFAYGIALVYGATGSIQLSEIATSGDTALEFVSQGVETSVLVSSRTEASLILIGIMFLLVGFAFKISAVPFHSWTPDVYQGSPTAVVGFMASAVKVAGVATLLRVLLVSFSDFGDQLRPVIFVLAALSLVGGAVMALAQTDAKRMMAFSSINHVGFLLVGIYVAQGLGDAGSLGVRSVVFYLIAYSFMVAGAFGIMSLIQRTHERNTGHDTPLTLEAMAGLYKQQPLYAGLLAFFLLAQAGVPFTAGFWSKVRVIFAATGTQETGGYILAAIAMLSAVIAAFLYLRIIVSMFMSDPDEVRDKKVNFLPSISVAGVGVCVIVVLILGIIPGVASGMLEAVAP